ncbi:MAG TPA: Na(+)/H(+) antiporter subunit D [Alphaproteobacteria bacterium]|jgi:multicomponent Na+:H+ antiporter subunit D|nr:Na(+)/H(+) antiporter subunit D [Alphaproteobacteria bacterium]HBC54333.1 Na(+)/H(+) antiporter subunit D [Alphaproteobacteria bacterium]HBF97317.1 Na(+)/H(+) antiporter subunit D [Alphaproteobacteria bacterium]
MIEGLSPALILILGALLVPFLRSGARKIYMLALPVLGLVQLFSLDQADHGVFQVIGYTITTLRIDALSTIFGTIFHIATFLVVVYALHVRDTMQHVAALIYAGAAIGAVFAGDMITLFLYWELTAIASVFLIWARRTESAYRAGMRYLLIQVGSGLILLAGMIFYARETGSVEFTKMSLDSLATWLIFIAFGIKCAFPLLHSWLQDAYPQATVTGTVVLSAFTTKLAVYALARGFPGEDILIPIGAVMAAFPIFYAVVENDLRRVLAYNLNNQLGFMVVGIGIGTELAINGTAAHAVSSILYKGLLFMSMGAVLLRAGTTKASELGGLYKSMPWTMVFCLVGAASISAVPLFIGFISKALIIKAAATEGYWIVWLVLIFASVGVFHNSGFKVPYFAFFGRDSGIRCKDAPWNMLLAMGLTAALCIGIGVYPQILYDMLPYRIDYAPYTTGHVLTQLQLLFFAALAITILMRTGLYPSEVRSVNLDSDWIYRRFFPAIIGHVDRVVRRLFHSAVDVRRRRVARLIETVYRHHGPQGVLARTWPTGSTVLWVALLLGLTLLLYYL